LHRFKLAVTGRTAHLNGTIRRQGLSIQKTANSRNERSAFAGESPLIHIRPAIMSYDYQGIASVITASRHLGTRSDECLNDSVNIQLTSSGKPTIARLNFDTPLQWPAHPNFVAVNLPDGSSVGGVIAEIEKSTEGPGWVTFTVDD
jgi:hypothetical protein